MYVTNVHYFLIYKLICTGNFVAEKFVQTKEEIEYV